MYNSIKKDPSITIDGLRRIITVAEIVRQTMETEEVIDDVDLIDELQEEIEIDKTLINENSPSASSIRRFIKGQLSVNDERDIPIFSFKRESQRGISANTMENKEKRRQAVDKLRSFLNGEAKWVCIGETSWRVASTAAYAWAERGEKCFLTKAKGGIRLTSICSIDSDGFGYCNIVAGTNTIETFETYMKYLVNYYSKLKKKCVFWCDNCTIHNTIETIVNGTEHSVVFNAAYSPELNPIENIFGIWKRSIERDIRTWNNLEDFLFKIQESFNNIPSHFFQSTFKRVRNYVWDKVYKNEDI